MARIVNSKSFNLEFNVENKQHLDDLVEFVNSLMEIQYDKQFHKFIQEKCMEIIQTHIDTYLTFSGNTVDLYKSSNKIEEFDEGFIIYNDTTVETDTDGYGGKFSIALAFEYGTGIVGQENPKENAWEYNVNEHQKGWTYFKNDSFHFTKGFEGFQIYTLSAQEIESKLPEWVNEYITKEV